ncbi:Alkaline phosphatase-like alpha/beta/alpha [Penicillium taxi]|uniref:Alkaline phosphatase-like alpha/beta/alpha n=1 Tax=Penicillium taxi TaxID=168475 RepID=UPI0025453B12|nr:Alkaline phosphatase-like alpha/beta/alpha [Penicillium taxi]KAJ5895142.1 Alkaline phosphatase-like alpha/beta/alpha [Penicillium taxi]
MSLFTSLPPLPPFLFSALVVSGLASKALHIGLHFHSIPFLYLVLFSPTLILPDLLVITFVRALLQYPTPETRLQWLSTCIGGLISLTTWGAAAIQFGFFMQTGAEVAWAASSSFVSDPAAMKILLSGISTVFAAATALAIIAWLIHSKLYALTDLGLQAIRGVLIGVVRARRNVLLLSTPKVAWKASVSSITARSIRTFGFVFAALTSLLILEITRPAIPYEHLSGALPLTLLDAFGKKSNTLPGCRNPALRFPLWREKHPEPEQWSRATWLPEDAPPGFSRWDMNPEQRIEKDHESQEDIAWSLCPTGDENLGLFNPKSDPLKISNLGGDIYEPLREAFEKHSVEIDHVVLLTLESGRKELFPVQQGTPLFDALANSHLTNDKEDAIDKLIGITPIAQMLTGEYSLNSKGEKADLSGANWHDSAEEGMGGLNVRGAVTGSSLTFKSVLGSHCGVHPLPVDLLEETGLEIYQPCLPQLFNLFNKVKPNDISANQSEALRNPWKSVFMQSITDDYDRQNILNSNMGFENIVVKNNLTSRRSKYRAKGSEINYFGYAETELMPYIRDLFDEAANNKTRMFLSHVTSTTHHPWNTPDNFKNQQYMGDRGSVNHRNMNDYLNTVRFVDNWLGDIMNMLDESGIANQTLVVIVGDHGQAFGEDNEELTGTYENGHISNFRVPLLFRHPRMPHIDIQANATSLSIIPTILDMLVQSQSLDSRASEIASALLPDYQGQSLIRPFVSSVTESHGHPQIEDPDSKDEMEARAFWSPKKKPGKHHEASYTRLQWNFGLVNAGGSMISVTAAGTPYRLVLPIKEGFEYVFTHLGEDPGELHPFKAWTISELLDEVETKYDEKAIEWLEDAEKVGKWWVNEQIRVWGYTEK